MTPSEQRARAILDQLAFTPFEHCLAITREFDDLPQRPGIYAIRHQREGLLYLGKTNNLGTRFNGGHKAFTWAWLDLYHPDDVRIAISEIERWGDRGLLSELEAILLRATEPPYNARIPMES